MEQRPHDTRRTRRLAYIHDEAAFEEGRKRRIMENARKGKLARWMADPEKAALSARLAAATDDPKCGSFLMNMYANFHDWGSLTDGQIAAVRKALDDRDRSAAERAERRQEARAADAAVSQYLGDVGERRTMSVSIRTIIQIESMYGLMLIHIMNDAAGNVVIYKGTKKLAEKGQSVTIVATVKKHDIRDGVKQTVVSRPKLHTI